MILYLTISNIKSSSESEECRDKELVGICIHREIVHDPDTRRGNQTGKCQTDGLNAGTYLTNCKHIL